MRKKALLATLVAAVVCTGVAGAQQEAPWLHIRVSERGEDGARISVNLPVSLVEVALELVETEVLREGRLHMHHRHESDITVADLRRAWGELRDAGDAQFVTVEDGDETVRISRQADTILIEITDSDTDEARIEVPVAVVDALFAGNGEELDIRGALQELVRSERGEIVVVDDEETYVRIWIED